MANRFARYVEQAPANRFAKYSQPEQDEPARTPDTSFFREPVSVGGRVGVGGEPVLNSVGATGETRLRLDEDPPAEETPDQARLKRDSAWIDETMRQFTSREGIDALHAEARAAGVPLGRAVRWKRNQLERQAKAGSLQPPETPSLSMADVNEQSTRERAGAIEFADELRGRIGQWPNTGEGEDPELFSALEVIEQYRKQVAPEVPGPRFMRQLFPREMAQQQERDPNGSWSAAGESLLQSIKQTAAGGAQALGERLRYAGNYIPAVRGLLDTPANFLRTEGYEQGAEALARMNELGAQMAPRPTASVYDDPEGWARYFGQQGVASSGLTLAGMGASLVNPALGAATFLGGAGGSEYGRARIEDGASPSEAGVRALTSAATEGIPEMLGGAAMLGRLPLMGLAQSTARGRAAIAIPTEAGTEGLTEKLNIEAERARGKYISPEEESARIKDAVVIGGMLGGGIGTGSAAIESGARSLQDVYEFSGQAADLTRQARARATTDRILGRATPPQTPQEAQTDAGAGIAEAAIQNALAARPVVSTIQQNPNTSIPTRTENANSFTSPVAQSDMRENDELDRLLVGALGGAEDGQLEARGNNPRLDVSAQPDAASIRDVAQAESGNRSEGQFLSAGGQATAAVSDNPQVAAIPRQAEGAVDGSVRSGGDAVEAPNRAIGEQPNAAATFRSPSVPLGSGANDAASDGNADARARFRQRISPAVRRDQAVTQKLQSLKQSGQLSDEQIALVRETLSPELSVGTDRVTTFFRSEDLPETMQAAQQYVTETNDDAAYAEIDFANLGGLNAVAGNAGADTHLAAVTRIIKEGLEAAGVDGAVNIRKGGDEFGIVAAGIDAQTLGRVMMGIRQQVAAYADAQGLSGIAHGKDKSLPPGIGIHFATSDIQDGLTVDEIRAQADTLVEARKKGKAGYDEYAGPDAAVGSAQGTDAGSGIGVAAATERGTAGEVGRAQDGAQAGAAAEGGVGEDRAVRSPSIDGGRGSRPGATDGRGSDSPMGRQAAGPVDGDGRVGLEAGRGAEPVRSGGTDGRGARNGDPRSADAPADRGGPIRGRDSADGGVSRDAALAEGVSVERQAQTDVGALVDGPAVANGSGRDSANRGDGQAESRMGRETGGTVDAVRSAVSRTLGSKFLRRLESQPWFNLVESLDQLPPDVRKSISGDDIAGFVLPDGRVFIIAENVGDNATGIVLHEVGVHFGMAGLPDFPAMLAQFKRMRPRDGAVARAYESVPKDTPADLIDEEAFAYYVEQNWNAKTPLMTRIKDAIARLLNRLGVPTSMIDDALMRQALDGMVQSAREAADRATRGAVTVRDGKVVYHKAWHGSPHDFDRFRLDDSTIGTGEGAQAFGHGLYFAGKRELGEYYREVLSENEPNTYTVDGVVQFTGAANPKDPRETAIYYLAMGADPGKIASVFGRPGSDENDAFVAALSALSGKKVERIDGRKGGRLYEVELAPSEDEYLDWDAPLSEQSEKVRAGVRQAIRVGTATVTRGDGDLPFSVSIDGKTLHRYKSEADAREYADELNEVSASEARLQMDSESTTTGEQAYRAISESKGGDREASRALHAAGIPGIRYLDGSSRGGKTGWRVKFKNGQYSGKVFDTKAEADAAVERGEYNMVDRVEKIDDLSHNFVIFDDSQVEVKAKYSRRVQDGRIRKTVAELTNAADSMGSWRDWYDRHDQTLRDVFGDDAELFQKLLSATSQAASVPANVGLALKAYRQLFSGEPFTGYLPAVIKNLDRVAASEALRGQKISEYGSASEGNAGAIAVDRHIAMLFFGTKSPNRKQVASAKNRIRAIAERLGWQPREVQAALWAYNQTLLGTAPEDVKSYDKLIEAARARIDALRASIGRGEDRRAREADGASDRVGAPERDSAASREQASAEVGPKYSRRADGGSVGGMDGKTEEYPILPAGILSQEQMLARGAGGHLSRAFERYIEVAKIDGREPTPGASDDIGYVKGRFIADPIEVEYDSSEDRYVLYAGNHRVTQAEVNGDKFIRAFVQPDRGRIGKDSTTLPSKAGLTAGTRYQDSRQAPPREGLGASGPRYSRRTRRADGGSVGGVGDPIKSLQADLARAEAKFEPLRKRRIYDGPEWDAVEQEASRIRKELYRLTGDAYGNQPKKRQARPSDAALNAEYPSPEDVPPEVLQFEQSRSALIADATDAQRWARIVDTLRDDRLAAGPVTLYRAVMGSDDIRPGDWVTTDREYAEEHNRRWFDGRGNIVEMEVDGRDVLASPTGNYEEAVFAPRSLSGPVKDSRQAPPSEGLGASGPRYSRRTPRTAEQAAALAKAGMPEDNRTLVQRGKDYIAGQWTNLKSLVSAGDAKQSVFDRFHRMSAIEQDLGIPPERSAYISARLAAGLPSIMEGVMMYGAPKWENGVLTVDDQTVGLLDALAPVKDDVNAWLGWMVGRRARALKAQGRENLMTDDDIAALLSLANGRDAEFQDAALKYLRIKNAILDVAEKAGLIDPAGRAVWDSVEYIPFYRQDEAEGDTIGPGTRQGLAGQNSGIRSLKGGKQNLADPLGNIVRNFTRLIDASLKNNAMLESVDEYGDTFFEKVPMSGTFERVPLSQVKKVLLDRGVPQSVIDQMPQGTLTGLTKLWAIKPPTDDDVVRVMRNGKAEYYRVPDKSLLAALTAFKIPAKHWSLRPFKFFKQLLTIGVTSSPDFMARNFVRDSLSSWVISDDKFRVGWDSVKGVVSPLLDNKAQKEMMFAGGSFIGGQFYSVGGDADTANSIRRALHGNIAAQSFEAVVDLFKGKGFSAQDAKRMAKTVALSPKMLWDQWQKVGSYLENANRNAIYENAIKAGRSKKEAAYLARDLMDFSMHGNSQFVQFLSDVLPFFNARLQGLYKLYRQGGKRALRKALLMRAGMIAGGTMALMAWNLMMFGDGYDELEEWDKDTYWHIAPGTEFHIRVPKPFELGVLFATIPERVARAITYQVPGGDAGDRPRQTLDSFLTQLGGTLAMNPIPQGVMPIVEQWANKSFFTGRPIENMGDEKLLPEARAEWYTSDTAKVVSDVIGNKTGLSPKRIEHLWNGYTGTIGAYLLDTTDALVRQIQGAPERPELAWSELPLFKAFYRGDMVPKNTRYMTDFYELKTKAEQVSGTIKEFELAGRKDEAAELEAENAWLLGTRIRSNRAKAEFMHANVRKINKARDELADIRKQIEGIVAMPGFTDERKRREIDALAIKRNEIAREITRFLRSQERQSR